MPSPTAGAIIFRKNNKGIEILLTRRNVEPFKGSWCLPGGHIEHFEKAETAIIREVKEETNLDFHPSFLTYMDEIFPEIKVHNIVLMFYGSASGELDPEPAEVTETAWFTIADAQTKTLAFNHSRALDIFAGFIGTNTNGL